LYILVAEPITKTPVTPTWNRKRIRDSQVVVWLEHSSAGSAKIVEYVWSVRVVAK